ncbi:hypothetical protein [Croceivirga sp. JEA036]|nr:hypothetical protein [Croceivirga sp. JEA036]NJB36366.1 hypothetical protein [Croceivirga sp. JEA036]
MKLYLVKKMQNFTPTTIMVRAKSILEVAKEHPEALLIKQTPYTVE